MINLNDNLKAIKMLNNVSAILKAIEYSDIKKIRKHLKKLKVNLNDFEYNVDVFENDGCYRK
jgi:hypothetical protein